MSDLLAAARIANFGAGPSALPVDVLEEAAKGLINFDNTGMGIAEISHRSKEFTAYLAGVEAQIRAQLAVPPTHTILFLQGGGTAQFSAVVLNMLARHRLLYPDLPDSERMLDYVVTGSWSKAAVKEAERLANGATVNIAVDARTLSPDGKAFDRIPPHNAYHFSRAPALIYYCENETVSGTQFAADDAQPESFPFKLLPTDSLLPLVADYSSSFMSRPIPRLADHAIIYAGAQKNLGPAGLTIAIVRQDCIVDVDAAARLGAVPVPIGMAYKTFADQKSMPNTPPVFSVYVTGLVLKRNAELGGVQYYEQVNRRKQEKVYEVLREGEAKGLLKGHVRPGSGSWMNVVFEVIGEGAESRFLAGAEAQGMKGLKGHRSVGGIRVSLYNAITEEETDKLVAYIRQFLVQTPTEQQAPSEPTKSE
ncbi:phosphoserine aminotransferase [Pholiota conissans]|uniref:phosphoserine transaminase n=1 Tax=Pholiota conissans TaxID=109636 RepID=A0A9P5YYE5_9AGAR|nr:phosphoserine aminotransferase [Pholiota conissans]